MLLVACGREHPAPTPPPSSSLAAPAGTLRFGYPAEPPTLDPLAAGGGSAATRDVLQPILPHLFRLDAAGDPQPELAERWPSSRDVTADPFSVTLHLRNARWSDGQPITADDVRFTLDEMRRGPTGYRYRFLRSIDVLGERTLRMRFDRPDRRWWSLFSLDDMVLPAHAYSSAWAKGPTVAGGPFAFSGWTRGLEISLVRNETYWGDRAHVKGIDVVFVEGDEIALRLLQRTELDAFFTEGATNIGRRAAALGWPVTTRPLDGSGQASGVWGPGWWELDLDPARLGPDVARAVARAIDGSLVAELLEDSGQVMDGIPPRFPVAGADGYGTPGIGGPWSGRGTAPPTTASFRLAFPRDGTASSIADLIYFRLKKIGVTIEEVSLEDAVFERTLGTDARAPAILRLRRGTDAPDAGSYASSSRLPGATPAVDGNVDRAETAPSAGGALRSVGIDPSAWIGVEEVLSNSGVASPLARVRTWIIGRSGVVGPRPTGTSSGPLWNAATWAFA